MITYFSVPGFWERVGGVKVRGGWREDEHYPSFFENDKSTMENQSCRLRDRYSLTFRIFAYL